MPVYTSPHFSDIFHIRLPHLMSILLLRASFGAERASRWCTRKPPGDRTKHHNRCTGGNTVTYGGVAMYCQECGTGEAEGALYCVNCGSPLVAQPEQPQILKTRPFLSERTRP